MGPDSAPSLSSQFMGQRRRRLRTLQASFFLSIALPLLFIRQQMKYSLKNSALPPSITIITSIFNAIGKCLLTNQSGLVSAVLHFLYFISHECQAWSVSITLTL